MSGIRLLVTGGSGFIGTTAMNYALAKGYDVKNIDIKRPNEDSHVEYWEKVDIRERDLFIGSILKFNPTHILHLAAKTGMDLVSLDELTANTEGVQNLIDGSTQLKNLKRVVFTSSLLVCENGYIPKGPEEFCPPNLYGQSKMIGEQIVRKVDQPFEWVIVRPTSIWGPWFEHSYKAFFQIVNKGLYVHPGKDDKIKPKSFVGNTVYMMYTLLFSDDAAVNNQVFYLADYPQGTTREWATEIARQLDKGPIYTIPLPILRVAAHFGDVLKFLKVSFPITSFRLNNMLTGGIYPIHSIEKIAGKLPYSLQDGCKLTIEWLRKQGYI